MHAGVMRDTHFNGTFRDRRYGPIAPPAMGRNCAATGVAPVDCGGYNHRDCPHRNRSRSHVFHGGLHRPERHKTISLGIYSAILPLKRNRKNLFTGLVPYDQ
jgi:hypothetical protein